MLPVLTPPPTAIPANPCPLEYTEHDLPPSYEASCSGVQGTSQPALTNLHSRQIAPTHNEPLTNTCPFKEAEIVDACRRGDIEYLQKNLKPETINTHYQSYDPTDETNNYYAPIHYAIKGNQLNVVKHLINEGCNIEVITGNSRMNSPLALSIMHEQPEVVELLLKNGANALSTSGNKKCFSYYQSSPIYQARYSESLFRNDERAYTDLLFKYVSKTMLYQKENLLIVDFMVFTAVMEQDLYLIEKLHDCGVNMNRTLQCYYKVDERVLYNEIIGSPKWYAEMMINNHAKTIQLGVKPLTLAAFYDDISTMELLIKQGATLLRLGDIKKFCNDCIKKQNQERIDGFGYSGRLRQTYDHLVYSTTATKEAINTFITEEEKRRKEDGKPSVFYEPPEPPEPPDPPMINRTSCTLL